MTRRTLFAFTALVPLALNVSGPAKGAVLMPMCSGSGVLVLVPLGTGGLPPGRDDNGCCIKGCHAGSNRKKLLREIEPAQ